MEIFIVVSVHILGLFPPRFPPLAAGISRYNKILQLLLKEYAVSKAWLHVPTWIGGRGGQLHKRGNAGSKVMWIINFAEKEVFFFIS